MARTLLQIVQEFATRTGIKVPNAVASSTDAQIKQVRALLHEEIEELTEGKPLQVMVKEFTFAATAVEDQGFLDTLCGEPQRAILNDILWNRTQRLPIFGPISAQDWQLQKAYGITGPLVQYRVRGDKLLFQPAPTAGHTIAGEFVRMYAVIAAAGTVPTKETFTSDDDTSVIPDRLLIAGLRWRWKREKGLRYAEDKERYHIMVANYQMKTGTKGVLRMDGGSQDVRPGIIIPPGSWPL